MLHPSYSDLMKVVNSEVEPGDTKVVSSRYSIVMATAKRARQIVDGEESMVAGDIKKPLSIAIDELNQGKVKILTEEEMQEMEQQQNILQEQLILLEEEIVKEESLQEELLQEKPAEEPEEELIEEEV